MIFSNIPQLNQFKSSSSNPVARAVWAIFWLLVIVFIVIPLILVLAIFLIPYYIYKKIKGEPVFDMNKFMGVKGFEDVYENVSKQPKTKPVKKEEISSDEEIQDVKFHKKS